MLYLDGCGWVCVGGCGVFRWVWLGVCSVFGCVWLDVGEFHCGVHM